MDSIPNTPKSSTITSIKLTALSNLFPEEFFSSLFNDILSLTKQKSLSILIDFLFVIHGVALGRPTLEIRLQVLGKMESQIKPKMSRF
jgi:hypothetical protein